MSLAESRPVSPTHPVNKDLDQKTLLANQTTTPLSHPLIQDPDENQRGIVFAKAQPIEKPSASRNKNMHYRFHRDHDHDTDDYHQLKKEIEDLIYHGYLSKYAHGGAP